MSASPHTVAALALALLEGSEQGFASVAAFRMIERIASGENLAESEVLGELIQLNGKDADRKSTNSKREIST